MQALAERLTAAFATGSLGVDAAARALTEAMETLCADADGSTGGLWAGVAGEAAAELISGLIGDGQTLPETTARGFAELIGSLFDGESVRVGGAAHPRLRILGAIEARLVRADRLVVAGLEEGVWPRIPPTDPFLSRPMRKALGLPPPERRIGLSAHDFAQAACAPEVVLLTTERRAGQPAVPSRWLWRLQTLARGAGIDLPRRDEIKAWARALDAPLTPAPASLRPAERPQPRPPVAARPRTLPVTRVETWVRDPYAVYARMVLGLRVMDRPAAPIDARSRGTAVHKAFQRLVEDHPDLPEDTAAAFEGLLLAELESLGVGAAGLAREQPLAKNLSRWVEGFERERRVGARLIVEKEGTLQFDAPGGAFTLTAKPDRLELRGPAADVLDFKTGAPPTAKQVQTGFAPQLTLTAAILQGGGFIDFGAVEPGELVYVRVTGRRDPATVDVRAGRGESLVLALEALEGLKRRVALFDREDTPYVSWSAPQFLKDRPGDYDHLARVFEWKVVGGDGEAEGGEA
jgi:ATP-dependent helicase/nuclease subunit B